MCVCVPACLPGNLLDNGSVRIIIIIKKNNVSVSGAAEDLSMSPVLKRAEPAFYTVVFLA